MTRKLVFRCGDFGDKLSLLWKVLMCWRALLPKAGLPIAARTMASVDVQVYWVTFRTDWTVWGDLQDGKQVQLNYVVLG